MLILFYIVEKLKQFYNIINARILNFTIKFTNKKPKSNLHDF